MHHFIVPIVLCLAVFVLMKRGHHRRDHSRAAKYMNTPYVTRTTRSGHKVTIRSSKTAHKDGEQV